MSVPLLLVALTGVFSPSATMTINGTDLQPLPPANRVSWPAYTDWTPHPDRSPTPTPLGGGGACADGGTGGGNQPGCLEPPANWQPSGGVLVVPIQLDIASWSGGGFVLYDLFFKNRQTAINYVHERLQAVNAALMAEANVRLQVTHINWWDAPASSGGVDQATAEAWWTQHPELRRGVLLFINEGGLPAAAIGQPCTGTGHLPWFWSDFQGLPNATTTGGYAPWSAGLTAHEVGHLLGLCHPDGYDNPPQDATCHTCPAPADNSLMSYCGGTAGVPNAPCGWAVHYGPRLARVIRWTVEQSACARAVSDPPCAGPDTDGDGIPDTCDNCPTVANHWQGDWNEDGVGDACPPQPPQCADVPPGMAPMATPLALPVALLWWGRRRHA